MLIEEHPLLDEIIQKKRVNSTSTLALSMIKDNLVKGNFLVLAEEQDSGKGRGKNVWYSPSGGLWFSLGLYNIVQDSSITLFMSVLLHETLIDNFPLLENTLKIKWPNDIFIEDKKICGILTSYFSWAKYLVCGIGLDSNVDELPDELLNIATSLKRYLSSEIDNKVILVQFLDKLYKNLPIFIEKGFAYYKDYFNSYAYLTDKLIELDTEFQKFSGTVLKVNNKGALILELDENLIQPFYSGTVTKIY